MENRIYYNDLFECYKNLLTSNERECFLDYYAEDFTLEEIANNKSVSRAAIHKTVKIVINKLMSYEEKLNLYKIKKAIREKNYKFLEELGE